ncbi:MAG: helix-turn-helix domain-containing protein [Cyclobacteriaceae bacterium]|nr:helix-turn-helix domain-containing protein [Cyclobacteriaceae bacterium SS2]MBV6647609.1 helix-turn-helix domain-containing protein [Cyclobacteriaceae bacterium HetDA_MAG_MS6]
MVSHYLEIGRLHHKLDNINIDQEVINGRNLYRIVLIQKGSITLKIDDRKHDIEEKTLYFIAPGQISRLLSFSSDIVGYCVVFDIDYFLLCLKNQVQLCFYPFFQFNTYPVLELTTSQYKKTFELIRKIETEHANREVINDDLLTKLYLNILLIEIERFYKAKNLGHNSEQSKKHLIASKFKQLVEKHYRSVRKVSEYADMLTMAPNYLNDVVKEATHQSASEIIHDRLILEAKAQLIQTEMSINEVAYDLKFNDSSYFCRFFRKQTGVSPQTFREKNHF